jgi:hypothetical protein
MWANLNRLEHARFDDFFIEHENCRSKSKKYRGVKLFITPTGIGTAFVVKCPVCKVKEDITDYANW